MEYLMTYGWAILVVMVVGIAMWQLGLFTFGGATSTTATGFPRLKPQLALISVSPGGAFTGTFTNGAGGPATMISAVGGCSFTVPSGAITAGENFVITGIGCTISGLSGDPYNIEMNITYNISLGAARV